MQALSRVTWQPGVRIEEFFSLKKLAVEANVDMRFVATLITAQLHRAVERKIKATVIEISQELGGEDGRKFLIAIQRGLL